MSIDDKINKIADVLYKLLTDVDGLRYRIEDLEDELQNLKHRIETVKVDIYNDKVATTTKEYEYALSQAMKQAAYDRDSK